MKTEFTKEQIKSMQRALDKWGLNSQVGMAIEECAELIVVLQKYINREKQPSLEEIIDEIADVEMMLAQMRLVFDVSDGVIKKRIEQKFKKLDEYLARE